MKINREEIDARRAEASKWASDRAAKQIEPLRTLLKENGFLVFKETSDGMTLEELHPFELQKFYQLVRDIKINLT